MHGHRHGTKLSMLLVYVMNLDMDSLGLFNVSVNQFPRQIASQTNAFGRNLVTDSFHTK